MNFIYCMNISGLWLNVALIMHLLMHFITVKFPNTGTGCGVVKIIDQQEIGIISDYRGPLGMNIPVW